MFVIAFELDVAVGVMARSMIEMRRCGGATDIDRRRKFGKTSARCLRVDVGASRDGDARELTLALRTSLELLRRA